MTRVRIPFSPAAAVEVVQALADRQKVRGVRFHHEAGHLAQKLVDFCGLSGSFEDMWIEISIDPVETGPMSYTCSEAAEQLGFKTPKTISRMVERGDLEVTSGPRPRVTAESLRAFSEGSS